MNSGKFNNDWNKDWILVTNTEKCKYRAKKRALTNYAHYNEVKEMTNTTKKVGYTNRRRTRGNWTMAKKIKYLHDYWGISWGEAECIASQPHKWNFELPIKLANYYVVYIYDKKK